MQSQHFETQERAIEYLEKSVASGTSPLTLAPSTAQATDLNKNRQLGCAELVPFGPLLHANGKASQGV